MAGEDESGLEGDADEELTVEELAAASVATAHVQHAAIVYDRELSPGGHVGALQAMHEADKKAEKYKNRFVGLGCVGGGGCVFLAPILADVLHNQPLARFSVALGVLFVIAAVVGYRKLGRNDVDDRKLSLPRAVLEILGPELKIGRLVRLKIDFAAFDQAVQGPDATLPGGAPDAPRFDHSEWLVMELPLLDGTRARVTVSTRVKRKNRRKRKYTKKKDQRIDEVTVALKLPPGPELPAEAAKDVARRFGGTSNVALKRCRMAGREATFTFRYGPARSVFARGGWQPTHMRPLVDRDKLLGAIIFAHKAAAAASAGARAPS